MALSCAALFAPVRVGIAAELPFDGSDKPKESQIAGAASSLTMSSELPILPKARYEKMAAHDIIPAKAQKAAMSRMRILPFILPLTNSIADRALEIHLGCRHQSFEAKLSTHNDTASCKDIVAISLSTPRV